MATKPTAATITKLAARRKEIDGLLTALTKERDAISEKLLSLDPDTDLTGNGVRLTFSPYRTLDTKFIERQYPASKHPDYYKLALDTQAFKKDFSANELEDYQKVTYRIKVEDA